MRDSTRVFSLIGLAILVVIIVTGFAPDANLNAFSLSMLLLFVTVTPFTGTGCCVYLWRVWQSDPGVSIAVEQRLRQGRSRTLQLFAVGSTLVVAAAYPILYTVLRRMLGEPPLPPGVGITLIGVFMLMALLVPHMYALHIWNERRESRRLYFKAIATREAESAETGAEE